MSADHHSPPVLPEPQTPAWLTGVGGVLFALAAVWWLTSLSADQRQAAGARAAAAPPADSAHAAPAVAAH